MLEGMILPHGYVHVDFFCNQMATFKRINIISFLGGILISFVCD